MALPKTNRLKYTLLRSRRYSLQDRLDYRSLERKLRYFKNCVTCFLIIIILHCSYRYIWSSDASSVETNTVLGAYLITQDTPDAQENPILAFNTESDQKEYTANSTTTQRRQILPRCINTLRFGPIKLNLSVIDLFVVESEYPMVKDGGYYYPPNCSTDEKIAIIVTYRSRPINLAIFLYNMHPILMEQQIEYQIFIIEQAGNDIFNKGCLYNVGFKEVMKLKKFRCIVFHDLDLLPMFLQIQYTCPTLPRHMSSFIDDGSPKIPGEPDKHKSLFGGVVALTTEMVYRVNGYSTAYFGWGGEDNDMFWRLRAAGYYVVRYNASIGVFKMLPHIRAPTNKFRQYLLATTVERFKVDGLSSLEYEIIQNTSHHLYTHILVDVNPRKQNITELMMNWATGNNSP